MKRREFVQLSLGAATLPEKSRADYVKPSRKEVFVAGGTDRDSQPIEYLDATFRVKVSGKDTEGRCVIFDTIRHQKRGPALHFHTDCDEWFFVKDGLFKFQVGNNILRLKAGDSLLVPQGAIHTFVKVSEGDATLIIMHQPAARMEEYFRFISQQPDQSVEAIKRVAEQYGFRIVGPPLTPD